MRIFWSFTRQSFFNAAAYKFEFWLQIVQVFFMMLSVYWVWNILYEQKPDAFGYDLGHIITYGLLGAIFEILYFHMDGPNSYMANQVRSGSIDTDLMKPLDFHLHMLARISGESAFRVVILVLPCLLLGFLFLHLQPPRDFTTALSFLLSMGFGFVVNFSLNFLLGTLAFVTLNIQGIEWGYYAVVRFFGGQLVPLWLFPGFIMTLADYLPFKCIYFIPISVFTGDLQSTALVHALWQQAFWAVFLAVAGRLSWNAVQKKLVVQGG